MLHAASAHYRYVFARRRFFLPATLTGHAHLELIHQKHRLLDAALIMEAAPRLHTLGHRLHALSTPKEKPHVLHLAWIRSR